MLSAWWAGAAGHGRAWATRWARPTRAGDRAASITKWTPRAQRPHHPHVTLLHQTHALGFFPGRCGATEEEGEAGSLDSVGDDIVPEGEVPPRLTHGGEIK